MIMTSNMLFFDKIKYFASVQQKQKSIVMLYLCLCWCMWLLLLDIITNFDNFCSFFFVNGNDDDDYDTTCTCIAPPVYVCVCMCIQIYQTFLFSKEFYFFFLKIFIVTHTETFLKEIKRAKNLIFFFEKPKKICVLYTSKATGTFIIISLSFLFASSLSL